VTADAAPKPAPRRPKRTFTPSKSGANAHWNIFYCIVSFLLCRFPVPSAL
jgi:hypothetical protein